MASTRGNLFKAQFGFELEDATIEQLRSAATKALAAQTKTAAQQAFLKTVPKPNPLSGRTQTDIIFGQNIFGKQVGGDPKLIAAAKAVGITGPNVLKGLGDTTAFAGQLPEDFFGLFLSNNGVTDASQISDQDLVKFSNEAATQFFENNKKGGLGGGFFGKVLRSIPKIAASFIPGFGAVSAIKNITSGNPAGAVPGILNTADDISQNPSNVPSLDRPTVDVPESGAPGKDDEPIIIPAIIEDEPEQPPSTTIPSLDGPTVAVPESGAPGKDDESTIIPAIVTEDEPEQPDQPSPEINNDLLNIAISLIPSQSTISIERNDIKPPEAPKQVPISNVRSTGFNQGRLVSKFDLPKLNFKTTNKLNF